MTHTATLPGLERIMEVCRREGLRLETDPAIGSPEPGELMLGMPFDPLLASFYHRFGGATFHYLWIYQYGRGQHEDLGMLGNNELLRRSGEAIYSSALLFGQEASLCYYYATLPSLADATGLQPVVKIDGHEERIVLPLASNVERFFDLYSRYLEAQLAAEKEWGDASLAFPWDVPELVARDTSLVEALMARRYDPWITHSESTDAWYEEVLAAARSAKRS